MAQRTTTGAVKGVLGRDYDHYNAPPLQPYIDTARKVIDRVIACAVRKNITIDAEEAELMERWMAADYYTKSDPLYKSKSEGGAHGSFADRKYRDAAIEVDPSGCLKATLERAEAGMMWLGKPPSEQIDAEDRS